MVTASSMLPLASWSAALHSIMPAPVRSRSCLTRDAGISTDGLLNRERGGNVRGYDAGRKKGRGRDVPRPTSVTIGRGRSGRCRRCRRLGLGIGGRSVAGRLGQGGG